MSKTQIDQLGNRIRTGVFPEADLKLLDAYRLSFAPAYESVVGRIRGELRLEPTGRPAKSTTSISDKLSRESIRLSQMQDIAGCRVVVPNRLAQDSTVSRLTELFEDSSVFDRREMPSSGYRAVHIVVRHLDRPIEIQVRTKLQHVWAEFSEKLSDVVDASVKYGGGPDDLKALLRRLSQTAAEIEGHEGPVEQLWSHDAENAALMSIELARIKHTFGSLLQDMIRDVHIWRDG